MLTTREGALHSSRYIQARPLAKHTSSPRRHTRYQRQSALAAIVDFLAAHSR